MDSKDFDSIVTPKELEKPIRTSAALEWVLGLLERYQARGAHDYLLFRKGITKELVEELLPLAHYCVAQYNSSTKFLRFYPGSKQSFDAEIYDEDNRFIERIEVTMAIDGHRIQIQNEALKLHGHAPLFSMPQFKGTKHKRLIAEPEVTIIESDVIVAEHIDLLQGAYNNKQRNRAKYSDITLLIGLDMPLHMEYEVQRVVDGLRLEPDTFPGIKCINIQNGRLFEIG